VHAVAFRLAAESVELDVVNAKPCSLMASRVRQPPRTRTILRDAIEAGLRNWQHPDNGYRREDFPTAISHCHLLFVLST
jgi:hypothetical protein